MSMIRVEVTSEADVTRMTAAFQVLPALRDCDYEIWLAGPALASQPWGAGCVRRAWRKDGRRGGSGTTTMTFTTGPAPPAPAGGGGGAS